MEWYLEPQGNVAHANKVFADNIGNADEYAKVLRGNDGREHNVWLCKDYRQVDQFDKSRHTLGIKFVIWGREKTTGPIRVMTFLKKAPRPETRVPESQKGAVS